MSAVVLSPCVSRCRLDDDSVCQGCFRTMAEIRRWGLLSPDEQRTILTLVAERRHQHTSPPDLESLTCLPR